MPTNQNAYNTRITDETLETRFRQTFRSQGGAELVDDLYASGVIVPVVDFTAAAEGSALRQDLQTAWDHTTGHSTIQGATTNLITDPGFWLIDLNCSYHHASAARNANIFITDGFTSRPIWEVNTTSTTGDQAAALAQDKFVVFLRSDDTLGGYSQNSAIVLDVVYRNIADVYGNLNNPTGFSF